MRNARVRPTSATSTEITVNVVAATNDVTSISGTPSNVGWWSHSVRNSSPPNGRLSTPPTAAAAARTRIGRVIVDGDSWGGWVSRAGPGGTKAGTVGDSNGDSSGTSAPSSAWKRWLP